jgi:peptide/nickel transport system permease protein
MLSEARDQITTAPWLSVFPGLAIFFTVLGLNLLGDGLRDYLDPQSTTRRG